MTLTLSGQPIAECWSSLADANQWRLACPEGSGLAAQPLPGRPRRGRTRLRPGRARQRQRRCDRARDQLAVAAQGLRSPRAGHASSQPEAVRQRAIDAARQRTGQPATPTLDPVFVALNPGVLPARERSPAELHEWVRRDEQYATLGVNVVVELYSESDAGKPTTRAWAITRRADRSHRLAGQRASRSERHRADRTSRSQQLQEREMVADDRCPPGPDQPGYQAAVPRLLSSLISLVQAQGGAGL
jgi:hypothetical protein